MSESRLIFLYSFRIVTREWRRFFLPLASLAITSVVLVLILLLTAASTMLLSDQARELQGGDVVLQSTSPIDGDSLLSEVGIEPEAVSQQISFSGTLQSADQAAAFTVKVIDDAYPLYGEITLENGKFKTLTDGEVVMDAAGLERLGVEVGDQVSFGGAAFLLTGVVTAEPTALFGGFNFLP